MKSEGYCFSAGKVWQTCTMWQVLTKVHIVKAMIFLVVTYGCESWIIKKEECQRIDLFKLWLWRLLKAPWIVRRSNQSILKEINPKYSLEGQMLKLKFHYFSHLMWTAHSLEKSLMLGKIESRRGSGQQRMRRLNGITNAMNMNLGNCGKWWGTERLGMLQSMGLQRVKHDWATE